MLWIPILHIYKLPFNNLYQLITTKLNTVTIQQYANTAYIGDIIVIIILYIHLVNVTRKIHTYIIGGR